MPEDSTPSSAAPSSAPDARIASALAWCRARRVHRLALAAPFRLDPATLDFAREQPQVRAIVHWPGPEPIGVGTADGLFQPDVYSWRLPHPCPPSLVFIDGQGALTARMIQVALRRRIRSVVYAEGGTWRRRSVLLLALGKLWSKLLAACVSAGGPGGGFCQSMLDIGYRRSIRPVLAAAPLAFGDRRTAAARDTPFGVVLACPTLVAGGAERQIVNTAIGLRAAGVGPITVLVARLHSPPGNAFFLDHLVAEGVDVREARSAESGLQRWLDTRRLAQTAEGARTLALLRRLPQAIRQEVLDLGAELAALNPAVVHCWLDYSNVRAGLAAVCAGVPRVVLSGRNVAPRHFPYIFEPFMRSAYRALLECPNVVLINNSRGGADDYAAWLGIDPQQIAVVYNGLDLTRAQRPAPAAVARFREERGVPADAPLIGGLFRFSAEKRPLLWIEVAAEIARQRPDARFLLFGEGPLRGAMQRAIDQHGLETRLHLLPPTRHSTLALAAFDVLLLTSQWEGTPNVAIEAQAVGTPVVLTGGGGASEAIADGETGVYVPTSEPERLARALGDVLGHASAPARRAVEFVERRFAMTQMLENTRKLYAARHT